MTLIVARIYGEKILILSDTKVSDPFTIRRSPLEGVLKVILPNPHLAIAYAGVIAFAESAIKRTLHFDSIPIGDVISLLEKVNKESNEQTEFVVASLQGNPRLYKISGGSTEGDLSSAWLGSHLGFTRYQREYAATPEANPTPERMAEAFERVLSSESIEDVGGYRIAVQVHPDISPPMLVYHMRLSSHNPEEFSVSNDWTPMPLGTAAGGAFCLSLLRTLNLKRHGVALHFFPGNFGILLCPQISFQPIHFGDVNPSEFIQTIKRNYDLTLEGPIPLDNDGTFQMVGPREGEILTP